MTDAEPSLDLDLRSPVPPFEQIRARVAELVALGTLRPGNALPSVRALAADLGIAPGTVARAYRRLEADGAVVTARGRGTRIADAPPRVDDAALEDALAHAVRATRAAGWDAERVRAVVERGLG